MLWVPQKGRVRVEHNTGTVGTLEPGTVATTAGTTTAKGTPVEMIASTAFDAYWVKILASGYAAGGAVSQGCMDILIGGATEEILIADLLMGYCGGGGASAGNGPKMWEFPLYIPAGSRLAVQAAGSRTSQDVAVQVWLYGGNGYPPFRVGTKVTTYGMGTVPDGTAITPGASGAEGSWTEITASTSEDHFALVPSFQMSGDATTNIRTIAVDIGIGSATEEEIAQSYWFGTDSNEYMGGPYNSMPTFQDVPSGTRLAMRASNNGTNDGAYNGVIHAVS